VAEKIVRRDFRGRNGRFVDPRRRPGAKVLTCQSCGKFHADGEPFVCVFCGAPIPIKTLQEHEQARKDGRIPEGDPQQRQELERAFLKELLGRADLNDEE
jgi:hypothetical protein